MASKIERDQIVTLKTTGTGTRDITKQLHVYRKTVLNIWKQYTQTAMTSSKPIPGRRCYIRTKPIVRGVMKRVERNSRMGLRKTAN